MLSLTLISAFFITQTSIGPYGMARAIVITPVCKVCGVRTAVVGATIGRLKASRRPRDREEAAIDLGRFHGECHPEIISVLSDALLLDPKDDVRIEAARSLGKLATTDPEARLALHRAARSDRDREVRQTAVGVLKWLQLHDSRQLIVRKSGGNIEKRSMPGEEWIVPGSVQIIESKPIIRVEPREVTTLIPPVDAPPPPPTPATNWTSRPSPPIEETIRRSSSKLVIPPSELLPSQLPPLEGPVR